MRASPQAFGSSCKLSHKARCRTGPLEEIPRGPFGIPHRRAFWDICPSHNNDNPDAGIDFPFLDSTVPPWSLSPSGAVESSGFSLMSSPCLRCGHYVANSYAIRRALKNVYAINGLRRMAKPMLDACELRSATLSSLYTRGESRPDPDFEAPGDDASSLRLLSTHF